MVRFDCVSANRQMATYGWELGQHRTPTFVVGDGIGLAERRPRAGDGAGVVRANSSSYILTPLLDGQATICLHIKAVPGMRLLCTCSCNAAIHSTTNTIAG